MAPKTKKTTSEPVRRSKRIASREPSVASDSSTGLFPPVSSSLPISKAVIDIRDSVRNVRLPKKSELAAAFGFAVESSITIILRESGHSRKMYIQKLTSEQREEVIAGFANQTEDLQSRVDELEEANARLAALSAKPRNTLRRDFTFGRIQQSYEKKLLEEQAEAGTTTSSPAAPPQNAPERDQLAGSNRGNKSPRQQPVATSAAAPAIPPPEQSSWGRVLGYLASPFSRKRAAPAEEEEVARSQKRVRIETAQSTPRAPHQHQSPREYAGPSAQNPKMPTSLSTITEYSEPSLLSSVMDSTPSRPSRAPSQRTPHVPQNTPTMPSHPEQEPQSTLKVPEHTLSMPQRTPGTPVVMRRSAVLRAARRAQQSARPPMNPPYAWEKTTSKPKEPNADARLAKMQRLRDLQKELEQLKQDDDIKDMEAHSVHRRKRVKVDELVSIPHNRPGDSASTFRVPDVDSDDEMEVDEDVLQQISTSKEVQDDHQQDPVPQFQFPEVGPRPADYQVTEEFGQEAGRLFEEGWASYLAAQ